MNSNKDNRNMISYEYEHYYPNEFGMAYHSKYISKYINSLYS